MRIVGGQYRGRQFNPGKRFKARPTTDMAKEGLFNILQNSLDFAEISALDLFAGTGSISFELASRGCRDITSVESDYAHLRFIKEVIERLADAAIHPVQANVFSFVATAHRQWDFIFADPPYSHPRFNEVLPLVWQHGLLAPSGLFVLEHSAACDFATHPAFTAVRSYGSVHFSFFKNA
ncbi:MAG: RsmD family RNA methyltransferase [Bacteroidales bacterium]|jgi:16S rRNA (guanine(966)-N(2))-methyltransferase RsmD|nr:RsmD family RNA methyltransferase [Bacteroidales bacterium]